MKEHLLSKVEMEEEKSCSRKKLCRHYLFAKRGLFSNNSTNDNTFSYWLFSTFFAHLFKASLQRHLGWNINVLKRFWKSILWPLKTFLSGKLVRQTMNGWMCFPRKMHFFFSRCTTFRPSTYSDFARLIHSQRIYNLGRASLYVTKDSEGINRDLNWLLHIMLPTLCTIITCRLYHYQLIKVEYRGGVNWTLKWHEKRH